MNVYLRIRPISLKVKNTILVESDKNVLSQWPENSRRSHQNNSIYQEKLYEYSKVICPIVQQNTIYESIVAPLFDKFLGGENCDIFAFGLRYSGKTYTIEGTTQQPGILPRFVSTLFDVLGPTADVRLSIYEIHQDKVYNILGKSKQRMVYSTDSEGGKLEIKNLSSHSVSSTKELWKYFDMVLTRRAKPVTTSNCASHVIYEINLIRKEQDVETQTAFRFIDLAANSERNNRATSCLPVNMNTTIPPQQNIDQLDNNNYGFIMHLWQCLGNTVRQRSTGSISSINTPPLTTEEKHTHLMSSFLNKLSSDKLAMVVCVNPHVDDYNDTSVVLKHSCLDMQVLETTTPCLSNSTAVNNNNTPNSTNCIKKSFHELNKSYFTHQQSSSSITLSDILQQPMRKDLSIDKLTTPTQQLLNSPIRDLPKSSPVFSPEQIKRECGDNVSRIISKVNRTGWEQSLQTSSELPPQSPPHPRPLRKLSNAIRSPGIAEEAITMSTCGYISGLHITTTSNSSNTTPINSLCHQHVSNNHYSLIEVEFLKSEIDRLRNENRRLMQNQVQRETEVRLEVSQHLTDKVNDLNLELQSLRSQLQQQGDSLSKVLSSNTKKKFQRKIKREVLVDARKDLSRDLQETEEQLEFYRNRNEVLTARNAQLELLLSGCHATEDKENMLNHSNSVDSVLM
mmetsp:Transcript_27647/g.39246  ORF Transcript_27647/g.39246 Transcript_27647/m.39246 type:complete len:680 (-) Transcript_27647:89-2128(-)